MRIISIGKQHEAMYAPVLAHFEKRLKMYTKFEWVLIPQSGLDGEQARTEESKAILNKIDARDVVILFDEKGSTYTADVLARYIDTAKVHSQNITCIIGGAFGVSDELMSRAQHVLSFGTSVFPHQLVRVMVLEQLYRAESINAGSNYHHS